MSYPLTGAEVADYLKQRVPAGIQISHDTTSIHHKGYMRFVALFQARALERGATTLYVYIEENPEWIFDGRGGREYDNLIRAIQRAWFGSDHDLVDCFLTSTGPDAFETHQMCADELRRRKAHREWQEQYRAHKATAHRRRHQKAARRANRRLK